jgi:nitric oxide reductase subunit B
MMATPGIAGTRLSPWWARAVIATMAIGFAVLILVTVKAYQNAPPIPAHALDPSGRVVFTSADIALGQQVFLMHGLMDNGTIWGHGAYLGPDFSAQYLHALALDLIEQTARQRFARPYDALSAEDRAAVAAVVAAQLKQNRYDPGSGTLMLPPAGAAFFDQEVGYWTRYFKNPATNGGLAAGVVVDPDELRALTAFFAWAAWASVAERPGTSHSYTNNFPYDPLAGNRPTGAAVLWSAISLIFLLAGIAIVLFAFGEFGFLGWRGATVAPRSHFRPASDEQIAVLKFMGAAAFLFVAQALVGGGTAHYRADPASFYGFDLAALLPSNLLRTWHLQLAIFWIATAYIGGALFVASILAGGVSPGLRRGTNVLFAAMIVVIVGSLLGEWAGLLQWLPGLWFLLGDQGWEYLEIGRSWQYALVLGLVFWVYLLWRALAPARRDRERRELANFLLIAAAAIPTFYLPALFFSSTTNYTVVDAWRFWIVHLWVEGFFEFFVTVIVAAIFYELGLVERLTALRVIYLDAVLYFSGGVIGTGHHWYFTGQTEFNMAVAATFSALEVVPLTLLTLDAWDFVRVTRNEGPELRHKWTFYFLMAVGVWNFVGAGVFGFLINLPIVSYYEVGTMLTPNHAHAAMMGVFGMLGVALMTFVLCEVVSEACWYRLQRYVKCSFVGLNVGLAMMVVMSLFPGGILQVRDVLANGYWHARSIDYTGSGIARLIEWLRLPGDLIFIFLGALPIALAMIAGWWDAWRRSMAAGFAR